MTEPFRDQSVSERWRRASVWGLTVCAATLPFSHVPAQLGLAAAICGWIGWSISSRRVQTVRDPFLWVATVYWAWNLIASAVSARPGHSLAAFFDNEWPATLGLLVWWTVSSSNELRRLLGAYFAAASVAFIYGVIQTFTGYDWIKGVELYQAIPGYARAVGFTGFPLTFAGFAMSILFLSGAYAMELPRSPLRWTIPVLAGAAILATFARSVWLATAVILLGTLMLATSGNIRRWSVAGAGLAMLLVLAVGPLRERALQTLDVQHASNTTRLTVWKTAVAMASDHLVFGVGQDNFTTHFEEYRVEGYVETFVHPHNDYLSALVHGGVVSLLAFAAMWTLVLQRGISVWRMQQGGLATWISLGASMALAGFLLSAMFQNFYGTFVNCFNWWLVSGLILCSYRLSNQVKSIDDHRAPG